MAVSSSRRRLAFVSHRFECNDGQGRVNYEVVKAALDHGYHVTVLATSCAPEIANHPLARFVCIGNDKLPTALLRVLYFARLSAQWLRKHRNECDMVQVNGFVTWERGDIAAAHFVHTSWRKNRYYPFVTLAPYDLYQGLLNYLNTHWEKRVFMEADKVIAVSKLVGRELEDLGVPAERITVIYNGVDAEEFQPGPADRKAFGLPQHVPISLFVGDIRTPRKNLETLLKALQTIPELHLVVAGAVEGSRYPAMARELGVADRVMFIGKIRQVAAIMRAVDVVVYPTRYDPFGLVVLEAMASGVPVISSAAAGIADHVGDAGEVLDDPEDVAGLASLMKKLIADPVKCAAMGQNGRRHALEMQWSAMTASYLAVYEEFFRTKL